MTFKLILTGLKERLKIYAGIALLYVLYAVLTAIYKPTARMDRLVDWVGWSYETVGVKIYPVSFLLLGMVIAALLVAEIIIFVRDFYSPNAYLLFSLPVNGRHVIGSRLSLFMLDFVLLAALDFPFRLSFYRTMFASVTSGEIGSYSPWLTTADMWNISILAGLVGILIFTIIPLLAYLLISISKCVLDLSVGWLTALVALGIGTYIGLCYVCITALPPMSTTYDAYPFIVVVLLIANVMVFWSGTRVIDRRLNI